MDIGARVFQHTCEEGSRAKLHLMSHASRQESTHWSISICFCVSPWPSSLPQVETNGGVHRTMWVSEWESGRESCSVCVCARVSVSDELHNHFLPAFEPSQKSLLFNPPSSLSGFLSIILKYLAKIQLHNFFFFRKVSTVVQLWPITSKLNCCDNDSWRVKKFHTLLISSALAAYLVRDTFEPWRYNQTSWHQHTVLYRFKLMPG